MPEAVDYKKRDREWYTAPEAEPVVVDIPPLPFIWIEGEGDPNAPPFAHALGALYALSYAVRMSHKSGNAPDGYYAYVVPPLEGEWTLARGEFFDPGFKEALGWTAMIRQPEFLTQEAFEHFRNAARAKTAKKAEAADLLPFLDRACFGNRTEGLCAQIMHRGPYDDEPATFEIVRNWLSENGYRRTSKDHREIYLSDPRRTPPEKLKTLLRVRIKRI